VERDLPVTLELLATLAEAGLGFDAALDRILTSQPSYRVLVQEFRTFQAEVLAGRPRVDCLRRIARRLDVTAVTILISALVQAEQIGSGVAEVLRSQADDLRQRRRERAIEFSMALPVKLLFPLVICFLPGILLFTLGPAFYEFFRLADTYSLHRQL
jgi:tight adherence protein C